MTREEFDQEIITLSAHIGRACPLEVKIYLWSKFHSQHINDLKMFFLVTLYFLERGQK